MSSIPFHPLDVPPNGIMGFITNAVSSLGAAGSFSHLAGRARPSDLSSQAGGFLQKSAEIHCLPCIYEWSMTNADLKLNLVCRHLTRARPCPESGWALTDTLLPASVGLPSSGTRLGWPRWRESASTRPILTPPAAPWSGHGQKPSILLSLENNPPSSAGVGKRHLGRRERMWGHITS